MGDCSAQVGGTASGVQRYTAFGEVRSRGGEMPTAYQYTGQLSQMEEVGLYHYGARWYDPTGAHFTQADTLIPELYNPLDVDRYAYGRGNPLKYTDPTGHMVDDGGDGGCGLEDYLSDADLGNSEFASQDPDGNGIPNFPDPNVTITIGTVPGCPYSSYVECFYARELYQINNSITINDDDFDLLMIAVFFDIRNRVRTNSERAAYDTPFWDSYGKAPGNVCFDDGSCYSRHEINYFAQGMWSAANNEPLWFGEKVIVGGWKTFNHLTKPNQYPSSEPSSGTLYWFEVGFRAFAIMNNNYQGLVSMYPGVR
ncbi:protein containing RHS repeat-associated core domain [Levilinea saccharolytica]|nr:protein containing RHS repeat-associated core domain [Levilinea saccharolytica]